MSSPLQREPPTTSSGTGNTAGQRASSTSTTDPGRTSVPMDIDPSPSSSNAAALARASDALLTLYTTETSALDKVAASYWREMINVKADMDIKVMEGLEAQDLWEQKEAAYLARIASLEKKVQELERALKEREKSPSAGN